MNILFVNNNYHLFAKADSGASQRSMRLIQALTHAGHVDVVSFADETVSNIERVDVIYSEVAERLDMSVGAFKKIIRLLFPTDTNDFYPVHHGKEKIIDEIITTRKYDIIVIRYIHFACECGLLKYADRLVIDIDDDPKQVLQMSFPNEEGILKRIYHRLYANAIDKISRKIIEKVRCAFFSTPNMNYHNAHFLPNISNPHLLPPPNFSGNPIILMVGWFGYSPNIEGLRHFITNVYPKIRSIAPNAEFNVVGKMADERLRDLCVNTDGVNVLGFVENLEEEYKKAQCVVVPIYSGTGTSVKMVEAMSLGRAVVATLCGARGLNPAFIPNNDYYLAETDNDFAQKVSRLITHSVENLNMANNAYNKIGHYYSEEMFNDVVLTRI